MKTRKMLKREDLPQFQMRESTLRKVNHWEKRLAALLKCNPVPLELCFDLLRDKVSILDEDLIETLQEGEKNFNKQIEEFKKDLAITKAQLNAEISLAIEGLVKAQKAASLKKQSNELNTVAKDLSTQHKNDLNILNGKLTIQLEEHKQILDQHNSDIRDLKQETSVKSQEIFVLREQIKNSIQIEVQEVKEKTQEISMLKDKIEEQNKIIEELKVQSESKDKQISAMEIEILGKVQGMSQKLEHITKKNKKAKEVVKTRFIKKTNEIKKLSQDQQHTLVAFDLLSLAEKALATINHENIELGPIMKIILINLENLRESIRDGIKPGLSEEFLVEKSAELVKNCDEFIEDIDMQLKRTELAKNTYLENLHMTPGLFTKDKIENDINSYENRIDKFEFLKRQWEDLKMETKKIVINS